jgi:hypothetical protein
MAETVLSSARRGSDAPAKNKVTHPITRKPFLFISANTSFPIGKPEITV